MLMTLRVTCRVLLGYDAAAKDHITLVAEGDGGYPELQKHWKDDDVQYGMCAFWVVSVCQGCVFLPQYTAC